MEKIVKEQKLNANCNHNKSEPVDTNITELTF